MKLTYIYHSGFAIETADFILLIDYYKDTPQKYVHEYVLNYPGRLYVLASHAHADHFNPEILKWKEKRPDIQYVLSEDIRTQAQVSHSSAVFLEKGKSWKDDRVEIKAFGSTDVGISFLIQYNGYRIFHAGDLNNWHWEEESTPEEVKEQETRYLDELELLARETNQLYLTFFPIDPRLGKDYMRGARQFIDRIPTTYFVPMHFWEKYEKARAFSEYATRHGSRFITLCRPGDQAELTQEND